PEENRRSGNRRGQRAVQLHAQAGPLRAHRAPATLECEPVCPDNGEGRPSSSRRPTEHVYIGWIIAANPRTVYGGSFTSTDGKKNKIIAALYYVDALNGRDLGAKQVGAPAGASG